MSKTNTIKEWLLPQLEERQMTVEDLAKELETHPKTIYRYFSGERLPAPLMMGRICSFLGVPFAEGRSQYGSHPTGRPHKGAA